MKKKNEVLELGKALAELRTKIKSNSKDTHFADKLLDEILSVKGQLSVEPTELNVGKAVNRFKGETFEIVKTDRGVLYHEYGGYNVFVAFGQNVALYQTLCDFVDYQDTYAKLTDKEKEAFDLNLSAVIYCLGVPKFCFTDAGFTYKLASDVIHFLTETYEKAMAQPLQEETIEQDTAFKEAKLATQELQGVLKEMSEDIKD